MKAHAVSNHFFYIQVLNQTESKAEAVKGNDDRHQQISVLPPCNPYSLNLFRRETMVSIGLFARNLRVLILSNFPNPGPQPDLKKMDMSNDFLIYYDRTAVL